MAASDVSAAGEEVLASTVVWLREETEGRAVLGEERQVRSVRPAGTCT